jgi:DNA-binding NarL/FixJ family response regulator
MSATIDVAIIEDDHVTRDGLAKLIGGTDGFRTVATYGSVEQALSVQKPSPDVLLLDIHLPGMLGSEGVALLLEKYPSTQILMLTVYAEQDKVFESICNGACGYLLKKTPPARLLEAIQEAHEGGAPMSPEIARKVVTLFRRQAPRPPVDHELTPREVELLALLAEGYSYESAGHQLGLSINTIRNHIRHIYEKLHAHSKSEAVTKALRNRLI